MEDVIDYVPLNTFEAVALSLYIISDSESESESGVDFNGELLSRTLFMEFSDSLDDFASSSFIEGTECLLLCYSEVVKFLLNLLNGLLVLVYVLVL